MSAFFNASSILLKMCATSLYNPLCHMCSFKWCVILGTSH